MPDELWTEVHDIIQETGIKTIPVEKNSKKQNGSLRRPYKYCENKRSQKQRRKGKIFPIECRVPKNTRRDKKTFLSDQYKEIEENNRMGRTRDLVKKIKDTKG